MHSPCTDNKSAQSGRLCLEKRVQARFKKKETVEEPGAIQRMVQNQQPEGILTTTYFPYRHCFFVFNLQ